VKTIAGTLQAWGPFGVLLLAALDSAGIPLPGGVDALIVLVAINSPAQAFLTATLAVAGSLAGCMFLFWIARKGGQIYLDKHASSSRAMRFRLWFQQYGLLTVFIPALLPIPLPVKVFVLSAGALGTRPSQFLMVVLAARIPRYFGLAWLGARLGEESMPWLYAHKWHLTAFAVALFAVLYLMVRFRANRRPL
jgi:membrane protein DedA with SNARE-associated domain